MTGFSCRLRLAALALLVFGAGSAVAATRYAGTCGAPNSGTITAAIAAAAAGDTILICPGTWNEAVTVNKDNLIIGSSTGNRADVTVTTSNDTFTLTGANTTLQNMTIVSTNDRGIVRGWTLSPSPYTFQNLSITARDEGVQIDVSGKVVFSNVTVTSSRSDAINLGWWTNGAHEFDNVTASGDDYGIYTTNGGAIFKDVTATAGNDDAIYMAPGYDATFTNVTATANSGNGIYLAWVLTAKTFAFSNVTVTAQDRGIHVEVSGKVTFANVNATSSNDTAIYLAGGASGAHTFDTVTVNGDEYGLYTANGGTLFKDITATAANNDAIYMAPGYDASFTNVSAASTSGDGIYLAWVVTARTFAFSNVAVTARNRGIYIDVSGKVTFANVNATSSNSTGIELAGSTNGAHEFDTVTAQGNSYGLYTAKGGTLFKDITATGNNNDAIYLAPGYDATFTDIKATSTQANGIYMAWVGTGKTLTLSGLEVTARLRGVYIDTAATVSLRNSTISSSNSDAVFLGYGAQGAHLLDNLTLDASTSGIRFESAVPSATVSNVCVNSGQYGFWATQWAARNLSISSSKFTSTTNGVRIETDPTYKATVSGNCIMKSTTPRAYSNNTAHVFNGNYWQGVAGGTVYNDGNIRDNSTLSSCPVTSCYSTAPPAPVADYRFDECEWTSGTAGAVGDSSGNAYHGTPYSVNTASGGVVQRSADLSASGTSDYLKWPLAILNGRTDLSVSVWFKTSVSQSQQQILQGLGSGTNDDEIRIYLINSTQIQAIVRDSGNTYTAGSSFVDGAWHHLAVTRNGSSGRICVYLDATSLGCNNQSSGALSMSNADSLLTGQEQDSYGGSFDSTQALRAQIDELKVFSSVLTSAQVTNIRSNELAGKNYDGTTRANACVVAPDHVRLIHDGAAIACSAESVTVRACSNADCSSLYTGGVTGNLTAGSNSKAFTIASGASETSVAIHLPTTGGASPQTVRLSTSSVVPTPSGTSPYCTNTTTSTTNTTTACDVSVSKAGFLFDVPTQTAGIASGQVSIQAVTSADSTQCIPLFQSVTRTVAFWGNYQNPTTGTMSVQVNGSAVETTSSPAYSSTYSLTFDATGTAKLTSVRYDDAGQMQLNARYAGSTSNTPPDGGMIVTGSDSFVVKPYGFKLSGLTCATADKLSSASGAFCVAGGTFTGTVEAVKYDVDATNHLGATTPNFGQESPTAQTVTFAPAALVNPTAAANGTLSAFTSSSTDGFTGTPKKATATMVWPNVGTITIKPTTDYLGAGDLTSDGISDSTASAGNVGRFYPHHFSLASGSSVTAACSAGGFTYMAQPNLGIAATVEARNKADAKTSNYLYAAAGGYANLGTVSVVAENANAGMDLAGRISSLGSPAWSAGDYAISTTAAEFSRSAAPDGTYESLQLGVKVTATDVAAPALNGTNMKATTTGDCTAVLPTADCDAVKVGAATKIRFGRLRLSNAFGMKNSSLEMQVQAQYWSGSSWVLNSSDACTAISAARAALSGYTAAWTTSITPATLTLSGGQGNLVLAAPTPTAPATDNTGSVSVAINLGTGTADTSCLASHPAMTAPTANLAYLRGMNGSCPASTTYTADPSARATFGIYSPETRRTVHVRETF